MDCSCSLFNYHGCRSTFHIYPTCLPISWNVLFQSKCFIYWQPRKTANTTYKLCFSSRVERNAVREVYCFRRQANNFRHNMYLLTEWEGRTGKYLARGHGVRIEHEGTQVKCTVSTTSRRDLIFVVPEGVCNVIQYVIYRMAHVILTSAFAIWTVFLSDIVTRLSCLLSDVIRWRE